MSGVNAVNVKTIGAMISDGLSMLGIKSDQNNTEQSVYALGVKHGLNHPTLGSSQLFQERALTALRMLGASAQSACPEVLDRVHREGNDFTIKMVAFSAGIAMGCTGIKEEEFTEYARNIVIPFFIDQEAVAGAAKLFHSDKMKEMIITALGVDEYDDYLEFGQSDAPAYKKHLTPYNEHYTALLGELVKYSGPDVTKEILKIIVKSEEMTFARTINVKEVRDICIGYLATRSAKEIFTQLQEILTTTLPI